MIIQFPYRRVYVGCSLTYASKEFIAQVEAFKEKLRSICEVLDFVGLNPEVTPRDIYVWDIGHCVRNSDLLIAICDHPSTGLGWEMATHIEKWGKPILAVANHYVKVTDLILDPGLPGYEFRRYHRLEEEVIPMVVEKLRTMDGPPNQIVMPFHTESSIMRPRLTALPKVVHAAA